MSHVGVLSGEKSLYFTFVELEILPAMHATRMSTFALGTCSMDRAWERCSEERSLGALSSSVHVPSDNELVFIHTRAPQSTEAPSTRNPSCATVLSSMPSSHLKALGTAVSGSSFTFPSGSVPLLLEDLVVYFSGSKTRTGETEDARYAGFNMSP